MQTVAATLLAKQIASFDQLERAIVQQMRDGGDLVGHLLTDGIDEGQILRALAEHHGVPPLAPGELGRGSETALQLVSPEIAWRFGLYPLGFHGGLLTVALSEPLPPTLLAEVSQRLGVRLELRFATLARIRQAIVRDYEIPLTPGLAALLGPPEILRSATLPGVGADLRLEAPPSEPVPRSERRPLASFVEKTAPSRRRLGPVTPALAKEDLESADSRDEVLSAFLDFAKQYFDYAAIFVVKGKVAACFDAHGRGKEGEQVKGVEVPLDEPGSLADSRDQKIPAVVSLRREGADGALLEGLGREGAAPVLLLPVVVRERAVAILYGDHGESGVDLSSVGDVLALAPLVGTALERLILRRKRA